MKIKKKKKVKAKRTEPRTIFGYYVHDVVKNTISLMLFVGIIGGAIYLHTTSSGGGGFEAFIRSNPDHISYSDAEQYVSGEETIPIASIGSSQDNRKTVVGINAGFVLGVVTDDRVEYFEFMIELSSNSYRKGRIRIVNWDYVTIIEDANMSPYISIKSIRRKGYTRLDHKQIEVHVPLNTITSHYSF